MSDMSAYGSFRESVRSANTRQPAYRSADPKTRSTIRVSTGTDNVSLTADAVEAIYNKYKGIKVAEDKTFTVYLDNKPYAMDGLMFESFINKIKSIVEAPGGIESGVVTLVVTDDGVVTDITSSDVVLTGTPDAATVIGALDFEDGSDGTIQIFADDGGDLGTEKTGTDSVVEGDFVFITAENGTDTDQKTISFEA